MAETLAHFRKKQQACLVNKALLLCGNGFAVSCFNLARRELSLVPPLVVELAGVDVKRVSVRGV